MHDLLVSPFLGEYLIVRPGDARGVKISKTKYDELRDTSAMPPWLGELSRQAWGADPGRIIVREESALRYGKASYELNLGCNYPIDRTNGRHADMEVALVAF